MQTNELRGLSKLKSVAGTPNSSLVTQVNCDSNFVVNEVSGRAVEMSLRIH